APARRPLCATHRPAPPPSSSTHARAMLYLSPYSTAGPSSPHSSSFEPRTNRETAIAKLHPSFQIRAPRSPSIQFLAYEASAHSYKAPPTLLELLEPSCSFSGLLPQRAIARARGQPLSS